MQMYFHHNLLTGGKKGPYIIIWVWITTFFLLTEEHKICFHISWELLDESFMFKPRNPICAGVAEHLDGVQSVLDSCPEAGDLS